MEIVRTIGGATLLVESNESHGLYFDEDFLLKAEVSELQLSQLDICRLLSEDCFRPILLQWEITDKCSFSCPFCYIVGHSKNALVGLVDIQIHLDSLIQEGLLYCILTGGEATIHPDFIEIYTYLREAGVIVEVYSNAAHLTEDVIATLRKYPPYKFEVTLYALSDDNFKANTGSKFSPSDVLNNVLALSKAGVNVICKTPVNRFTMVEMDGIRAWCRENAIKHYHSTDVANAYDGSDLSEYLAPLHIKTQFDAENESAFRESHGISSNVGRKTAFSCSVGTYGVHINSAFQLLPCATFNGKMPGYDIRQMGIRNALHKLRILVAPIEGNAIVGCAGCKASAYCKTCPATADEIVEDANIVGYRVQPSRCTAIQSEYENFSSLVTPVII